MGLFGPDTLQLFVFMPHVVTFKDIVVTMHQVINTSTYFRHFTLSLHTKLLLSTSAAKLFHVLAVCAMTAIIFTACIT